VASAVFGTSVFILNQRFVDSIRYPHTIETIAWIPWIVYFLIKTIDNFNNQNDLISSRQKYIDWLLLCLSTLLSWLAGYGHYTYIAFIFSGILLVVLSKTVKSFIWGLGGLGLGAVLAVGVLLPTAIQLWGSPTRGGSNIVFSSSCPVGSYFHMFMTPFGSDVHSSSYFPLIYLIFCVFGMMLAFTNSNSFRLKLGMLLSVVILGDLSLGLDGFLFKFFYNHVPLYHSFRIQGRNNWITIIPICYFCAVGIERFISGQKTYKYLVVITCLFLSVLSIYLNYHFKTAGGEFTPYGLGWITAEQTLPSIIKLTFLFSGLFVILILSDKTLVQAVGLILLCSIFVTSYARYETWLNKGMQRQAVMKVADYFPDGIFVPFKRGSDMRSLSPVVISDSSYNPKFNAYDSIVKNPKASSGTRFAFSPTDKNRKDINVIVEIEHYNPNEFKFKIQTPIEGEMLFFSSFSRFWKSNVSLRRGKGEFSPFTVFSVPAGTTEVEMTFRPIIFIIGGLMSIAGVFCLASASLYVGQKKNASKIVATVGLLMCVLYLMGVYSPRSFSATQLFGKEDINKAALINIDYRDF
jgi:hypothetical protein